MWLKRVSVVMQWKRESAVTERELWEAIELEEPMED